MYNVHVHVHTCVHVYIRFKLKDIHVCTHTNYTCTGDLVHVHMSMTFDVGGETARSRCAPLTLSALKSACTCIYRCTFTQTNVDVCQSVCRITHTHIMRQNESLVLQCTCIIM